MRRQKTSRTQEILQTLMGLNQLDSSNVDQLSALQNMGQKASAEPGALQSQDLQNQLLQEQVASAPQITKAKIASTGMDAAGRLGEGLGMSAPQIAPDVMSQVLQNLGMYHPDPNAFLTKLSASTGIPVDKLKAMQVQMNSARAQQQQ